MSEKPKKTSKKTKTKKPIQVYLDEKQLRALRYQSEHFGKSISQMIREGVDLYIAQIPIEQDPAMSIIGIGSSDVDDLAENHDKYLYEILMKEHNRYEFEDQKSKEKT